MELRYYRLYSKKEFEGITFSIKGISAELATRTRQMMNRRLASAQICSQSGTQELRSPTPSLCARLFAKCSQYFACRLRGYRATEGKNNHTDHLSLSCKIPTALHLRYIPPPLQTPPPRTPQQLCNSLSVKTRKY